MMGLPEKNIIRQPAWLAAMLMTVAAVWLHFYFLLHAGGFWRDEVNLINLASRHSLAGMKKDSFPILMPLTVKSWSALGLDGNETSLRLLGTLIGLGIPAALWVAAWTARRSPPLLSLALFALNSLTITYSDSFRAHGLGSVFIALATAAMWAFLKKTSWPRAGLLAVTAILSVQTLYQNAVLFAAVCLGAWLVCWRRRDFQAAVKILAAALAAAASLLPYWENVMAMPEAAAPLRLGFVPSIVFTNLDSAVAFPLPQYAYVWELLALAVVGSGVTAAWRARFAKSTAPPVDASADDLRLFAAASLLTAFAGFVVFLRFTALLTQPWYFLPLVTLAAVCFELGLPPAQGLFRAVFFGFIMATALIAIPFAQRDLNYRLTNLDTLARRLATEAAPNDLIIVSPWPFGISFDRYFKGATPWTTLPPLADHSTHRFDLVKAQMGNTNAIRPVLDQMAGTLQAGRRVWVVGTVRIPTPDTPPPVELPPPPLKFTGWLDSPYSMAWTAQAVWFLNQHSLRFECVADATNANVSFYENAALLAATGWKNPEPATSRP